MLLGYSLNQLYHGGNGNSRDYLAFKAQIKTVFGVFYYPHGYNKERDGKKLLNLFRLGDIIKKKTEENTMMNSKVRDLLNQQINKEFYSAYLYLEFSNYFDAAGLDGTHANHADGQDPPPF